MGLWGKVNNRNFKVVEFDHFKTQAGLPGFVLSPSQWVEKTNAKGICSKTGSIKPSSHSPNQITDWKSLYKKVEVNGPNQLYMKKIKIAAVSYLNTKPFLFGLENHLISEKIEILREIPSECFRKFLHKEVDIGLVPIGGLHELEGYEVISDFCIASSGKVQTVCLFSEIPLDKIETVLLDFHSVTSVLLTKAIFKNHWKLSPGFSHTEANFEADIKGETAGLIIGDRATSPT